MPQLSPAERLIHVDLASAVRGLAIDGGEKTPGAGAPRKDLYDCFGITPEAVIEEVSKLFSA